MIWQASEDNEFYVDYKFSSNPLMLSFQPEVEKFIKIYDEHLFEICLSNSSLRYVLRFHLNPKLIQKTKTGYTTNLLGKKCDWNFQYQFDSEENGEYLKTLKMGRDESIAFASKWLQDHGQSGYILFREDMISRYKDDPESQAFKNWIESLGILD